MRLFYTDGSKQQHQHVGGWALLEVLDGKIILEKWDADYSIGVTSNQMELKAAVEALKLINIGESVTIYSDSQYVVKGITEWITGWKKNNWLTHKGTPVLHKELWLQMLDLIIDKNIDWVWVRSHDRDQYNNRADSIAKLAYLNPEELKQETLTIDENAIKPEIGSIVYFEDPSKRYIVMLNDFYIGKDSGFLAKLLANNLGNETEFFQYGVNLTIIKDKSDKESRMVFKTIEQFKNKVSKGYDKLKKSCKHNIQNNNDAAWCSICNKDFGWHCVKSKDKCCHYFSENGKVKLVNGELIDVPKNHDKYSENYDECIFCHEPEERK